MKINKLMVIIGLATTVTLVGCKKQKSPEAEPNAATEQVAEQPADTSTAEITNDIEHSASQAAAEIDAAANDAVSRIDAAAGQAATSTQNAVERAEISTREATHDAVGTVEETAKEVKEDIKKQQH